MSDTHGIIEDTIAPDPPIYDTLYVYVYHAWLIYQGRERRSQAVDMMKIATTEGRSQEGELVRTVHFGCGCDSCQSVRRHLTEHYGPHPEDVRHG